VLCPTHRIRSTAVFFNGFRRAGFVVRLHQIAETQAVLGRLCRNYAEKTLAIATVDLIDRYEAKSLDRDTLRAIAVTLFGVTDLD
jgi:hypothetical protein